MTPQQTKTYESVISTIKEAIIKRMRVNALCLDKGLSRNHVANFIWNSKDRYNRGIMDEKDYNELITIWGEYQAKSDELDKRKVKSPHRTSEEKVEVDYDAMADDAYDERSSGDIIRNEDETIKEYNYKILIRDEPPLSGTLSREEMDTIYRLYSNMDGANLTQRTISRLFPTLTFKDFKRILRAFNITKASIPVAPHIMEELSETEIADYVFRNKENNVLRLLEQKRGQYIEKHLEKAHIELIDLRQKQHDTHALFEGLMVQKIEPIRIKPEKLNQERALLLYMSDQHVGAMNPLTSLYENEYGPEEFERRTMVTLQNVVNRSKHFGRFDRVIVCNLGDCLDGYDGETVRGGHSLPQNLDNKEQFNVYIETMRKFFDALHRYDVANAIDFYSVGDSNHSGDFGYMANKTLEYILGYQHPEMNVKVFEKFIDHFEYGIHTFILTHGKDKEDKKFGFPLNLDLKTEIYFEDYINNREISDSSISVIKGDLHSSNTNYAKRFRYKNVASLYGASKWIQTNYGSCKPAVDYDIAYKNEKNILSGRILV